MGPAGAVGCAGGDPGRSPLSLQQWGRGRWSCSAKPPGSQGQLQRGGEDENGSRGLGMLSRGRGAGRILATGLGSSFPSLCFVRRILFLPVGIPKTQGFLASILLACVFLSPREGKIPFCLSLPRPGAGLHIRAGETRARWCWGQGWVEDAARSVVSPATKIAFSDKKRQLSTGRRRRSTLSVQERAAVILGAGSFPPSPSAGCNSLAL